VDLGQKQDHSAVAFVKKRDKEFDLVLLKQFELEQSTGPSSDISSFSTRIFGTYVE